MLATTFMPLTKPRQALPMSKLTPRSAAHEPVAQAGRRRLEVVAAHRGVQQRADVGRSRPLAGERELAGLRGHLAGLGAGVPDAALGDAGQALEQAGLDAEPLVGARHLRLDLGRRDDVGCVHVREPADDDLLVPLC
jgi:hypothetical protein